jgi:hypothetical protein
MAAELLAQDLTWAPPSHTCLCGSTEFLVHMAFEDFRPAWWGLDAECIECGSTVKVVCPADRPTGPNEDGF